MPLRTGLVSLLLVSLGASACEYGNCPISEDPPSTASMDTALENYDVVSPECPSRYPAILWASRLLRYSGADPVS